MGQAISTDNGAAANGAGASSRAHIARQHESTSTSTMHPFANLTRGRRRLKKMLRSLRGRGGGTRDDEEHLSDIQSPPPTHTILLNPGYASHHSSSNDSFYDADSYEAVNSIRTSLSFSEHTNPPRNDTRRQRINEQYDHVLRAVDSGMLVQFQTLSALLESVTMSTMRRLVNSDLAAQLAGDSSVASIDRAILDAYVGERIDRMGTEDVSDSSFSQFLDGLNSEHLLQRELGTQALQGRNLSFFRAFRFNARDQHVPQTSVPVLIVGLVSINHRNAADLNPEADTFSAEGIISQVSGSHEGSSLNGTTPPSSRSSGARDPTPGSESLEEGAAQSGNPAAPQTAPHVAQQFETRYPQGQFGQSASSNPFDHSASNIAGGSSAQSASSNAGGFSTQSASNNAGASSGQSAGGAAGASRASDYRSWIIIVMAHHYSANDALLTVMPLFINLLSSWVTGTNSTSPLHNDSPSDFDDLRDSIFQIFAKDKKLTRSELARNKESLCTFVHAEHAQESWQTRTAEEAAATAHYDTGDKCPICMVDYADGDPGRKLRCRHAFHRDCIDEWLVNDNSCPICRGKAL